MMLRFFRKAIRRQARITKPSREWNAGRSAPLSPASFSVLIQCFLNSLTALASL